MVKIYRNTFFPSWKTHYDIVFVSICKQQKIMALMRERINEKRRDSNATLQRLMNSSMHKKLRQPSNNNDAYPQKSNKKNINS